MPMRLCWTLPFTVYVPFAASPSTISVHPQHPQEMQHNQKILKLGNIGIVEYLNQTHPSADRFLIKTEKHNTAKYREELSDHLHLSFVDNCDTLMEILNIYKSCYAILQNIQIAKPVRQELKKDNSAAGYAKQLKKAYGLFSDDMSPFITDGERSCNDSPSDDSDYFSIGDYVDVNSSNNGSSDSSESGDDCNSTDSTNTKLNKDGSHLYTLKHSLPKSIIQLKKESPTKLSISTTSGISYVLVDSPEVVDEFYIGFIGETPEYNYTTRPGLDHEYVEFLLETGKTDQLRKYLSSMPNRAEMAKPYLKKLNIADVNDLKLAMEITGDSHAASAGFVLERFLAGLNRLNRIQRAEPLIIDVFDYFEEFVGKLEDVFRALEVGGKDTTSGNTLTQSSFILCVEQLILCIFDFLEPRVYNKFYEIAMSDKSIELIKKRLKFGKFNFGYLIDNLLGRKEAFAKACLENAQMEILKKLESI